MKIGLVAVMTMDIALMVDSQMLLETMGLFGFVVVMAMDIALTVDTQVLLETMGLFVPRAGHQLFVEEMDLVVALDR